MGHGIAHLRHADLRPPDRLPAGPRVGQACICRRRPRAGACMVILTSSAGVQRHREDYYAQALNEAGTAACIATVSGAGAAPHVADQDAGFGRPNGGDALQLSPCSAAIAIDPGRKASWACPKAAWHAPTPPSPRASAGAATGAAVRSPCRSVPGATAQHRDATTSGRPMSSMLAGKDDYTPAALAIRVCERMRAAATGGSGSRSTQRPPWLGVDRAGLRHSRSENWSCCRNLIEDDGRHFLSRKRPRARRTCVPGLSARDWRDPRRAGGGGQRSETPRTAIFWLFARTRFRGAMDACTRVDIARRDPLFPRTAALALGFASWRPFSTQAATPGLDRRADAAWRCAAQTIRAAPDHGLEPAWYGLDAIDKALAQPDGRDPGRPLLTEPFVTYASDVSTGRVAPTAVDKDISIDQRKVDRADLLKAAADSPILPAGWPRCRRARRICRSAEALAHWRAKRGHGDIHRLPDGPPSNPHER